MIPINVVLFSHYGDPTVLISAEFLSTPHTITLVKISQNNSRQRVTGRLP